MLDLSFMLLSLMTLTHIIGTTATHRLQQHRKGNEMINLISMIAFYSIGPIVIYCLIMGMLKDSKNI